MNAAQIPVGHRAILEELQFIYTYIIKGYSTFNFKHETGQKLLNKRNDPTRNDLHKAFILNEHLQNWDFLLIFSDNKNLDNLVCY